MQPSIQQTHPSQEDIAALARQIWEKNGRPTGKDMQFWLEAEQSLLRPLKTQPPAATPVAGSVPPPPGKPSAPKLPGPRSRRSGSKPAKGAP